jgi:hypothetical protein
MMSAIHSTRKRAVRSARIEQSQFQRLGTPPLHFADEHLACRRFTTTRSPRRIGVAGDTTMTSPSPEKPGFSD